MGDPGTFSEWDGDLESLRMEDVAVLVIIRRDNTATVVPGVDEEGNPVMGPDEAAVELERVALALGVANRALGVADPTAPLPTQDT